MIPIAKQTVFYSLSIFLFVIITASHAAQQEKAPFSIAGTVKVAAEDVFDLAESIPSFIIIDSRKEKDRNHGFIKGSVSLPDTKTNCESLGNILTANDSPVMFYCNGVRCGRSGNAARIALKCGYNNIYWFRGGLDEWKEKKFPTVIP